ncbi:MAG: hypothetical protein WAW36_08705 [Methylovulum miyakonense]|uniref:hypothetical protein n=1 Tax=Methylovulum miyakonense TaxID=645578 RepID=UPI003BB7D871
MFDKILNEPDLFGIVCGTCSENGAAVEFDESLKLNDGELDDAKVLILKPDAFYSTSRIPKPPPAPDCLILVNCLANGEYDLYLIELKDVSDTKQLKHQVITEKFKTMTEQFFVEFAVIFSSVNYGLIKFYLVTTYPKGGAFLSEEGYRKKIKNCHLETYASLKPLPLFGKAILIEPKSSPLTISAC